MSGAWRALGNRAIALPSMFRLLGAVLTSLGISLAFAKFRYGFAPTWLNVPMFAIHSLSLQAKSFTWINTNITGEIALVMTLAGLYAMTFARERDETPAIADLRRRSLAAAFAINTALLVALTFTIFGLSYIAVLTVNVVSTFAIQQIVFRVYLRRHHANVRTKSPFAHGESQEVKRSRVTGG